MRQPSLVAFPLFLALIPFLAALKFGTVQVPPFTMRKKECLIDNGQAACRGNNAYEGYCVDLMALLAKEIDVDYRIEIRRKPGGPRPDGSWDGLVEDLNETIVDVAVALIAVTPETSSVLDLSPPFLSGGLSLMIKKPDHRVIHHSLNPYSTMTWLSMIMLQFMSASTTLVLLTQSRQAEKLGNGRFRFFILSFFLFIWMMGTFAWIASIVHHVCTVSAYNAQTQPTPYIDSIEELMAQDEVKYGMQRGGDYDTYRYFRNSNDSLHKKMLETMERNGEDSFTEYYKRGIDSVRNSDGNFAFIIDDAINRYENTRKPCDTRKIGANVATYHYAVATKKGSPLSAKIAKAIKDLQDRGEIAKIHDHWFIETTQCPEESNGMDEISVAELGSACIIYTMISGISLSIVFTLIAVYLEKRIRANRSKYNDEAVPMTSHSDSHPSNTPNLT